jgi:glutaminase A-like protein
MQLDRPFTDLYETETGGWPGPHFKARPVVGGHFAFLALGRACGGRAVEHLSFLDEPGAFETVDVDQALEADRMEGEAPEAADARPEGVRMEDL